MHVLERDQFISAPLPEVWDFFSDPENLARITPAGLEFRIVGVAPKPLSAGARIDYRIRWTLLRLRWVTRIGRWEPPRMFEDVQERGPYRQWVHTHRFAPERGGTRMSDRIAYALPFGPLGRIAHRLLVRRQLEAIFDHRREAILDVFPPSGALPR